MFKEIKKNIFVKEINNKQLKLIFSKKLFKNLDKDTLKQFENICYVPNVSSPIIGLPDAHFGYGVPIGSAFLSEICKDTIISSEAIGYDIGCGIRLIKTSLFKKDLNENIIFSLIKNIKKMSLGLSNNGIKLNNKEFITLLKTGSKWAEKNGWCEKKDLQKMQYSGNFKINDLSFLPKEIINKGIKQVGTVGLGNHFIDIVYANNLKNKTFCKKYNIKKNQLFILIHTGSRGYGYEIAKKHNILFKQKEYNLSFTPFVQKLGQRYYQAMLSAMNFAFVNRTVLQKQLEDIFKKQFENVSFDLFYDLCHNYGVIEKHNNKKYLVHRKGAVSTYFLSAFYKENTPVILPGSMLSLTHVLLPTKKIVKETFCTLAHGSGRQKSRTKAKSQFTYAQLKSFMLNNNVYVDSLSKNTLLEEQPFAYKDSKEVINTFVNAKLVKEIFSLKPLIVVLG